MEGTTARKTLDHMDNIKKKYKEAIRQQGTERVLEIDYYLEEMNLPQENTANLSSECGGILRGWFQEAARDCVDKPKSLEYAVQIRQAIREMLSIRYREGITTVRRGL